MAVLVEACAVYVAAHLQQVAQACPDLGALPTELFAQLVKVGVFPFSVPFLALEHEHGKTSD